MMGGMELDLVIVALASLLAGFIDAVAAQLAWERTLAAFKASLG